MKKIVIFMVLAMVIATGVFAQGLKHWISGEASLLGGGIRYEYMVSPKFSIGANAYAHSLFIFWNDFGVSANARFYISKIFFLEGGLGFSYHTGTIRYTYKFYGSEVSDRWLGSITGAAIIPAIGWKIDVGKPGGFFVQPGLKLPVTLGAKSNIWGYDLVNRFGVGFNIIGYCGFGYAF